MKPTTTLLLALLAALALPMFATAHIHVGGDTLGQVNPHSGESIPFRFGGYVHGQVNPHFGHSIVLIENQRDGGGFSPSTTLGVNIGALAEYRFSDTILGQLRVGYTIMGGTFKDQPHLGYTETNLVPQPLDPQRSIITSLAALTISPAVVYRPFSLPVRFELGPEIDVLVAKTFEQYEEIQTPGITWVETGTPQRHDPETTITGASSVLIALRGTIGYEIPLDSLVKNLTLTPQLEFAIPFNSIATGDIPDGGEWKWRTNMLRFGIAVTWRPESDRIVPPPPEPRPMECLVVFTDPLVDSTAAKNIEAELRARGVTGVYVEARKESPQATEHYRVVSKYNSPGDAHQARINALGAAGQLNLNPQVVCK